MFSTRWALAVIFVSAMGALNPQAAKANRVSEDLAAFEKNSGEYTIKGSTARESDAYCLNGYDKLTLQVNAREGTITEILTGNGTINGVPTAGRETIMVSLSKRTELPSSTGVRTERTVISGRSIITQESTWAPLFGLFGEWHDSGTLIELADENTAILSDFRCVLVKQ